ncbi:hypothetical protein MMC13_005765 [Lambiella insularis]|nr:hypothetical protein [Lambiella insularis]
MTSQFGRINERLEQLDERVKLIEAKLDRLLRSEISTGTQFEDAVVTTPKTTEALSCPEEITQNEPYIYDALDIDRSEIRLLALHFAEDETNPIVCELQKVELGSEPAAVTARSIDRFKSLKSGGNLNPSGPKYNALSYNWGSPNKTGHIILNGHLFSVTKNLEIALRQFRQIAANTVPHTKWWIDAICINQDDVLERNSQVSLMCQIYKKADHVSIWLGEEADDSSLALHTIVQLSQPSKRAPGEALTQSNPTVSADEKLRCWRALWALYQRPWFERAWVRQEVALSQNHTVYCGAYSCKFGCLKTATLYLDYVYNVVMYRPIPLVKSTLGARPYEKLNSILELASRTSAGARYAELADLLTQTRNCQATDLRDKVFSVLGLADLEKYHLQADYRLPLTEVFISTTRCVIEASKRVDILRCCQSSAPDELPSWVPDYAKSWERTPFKKSRNAHELDAEFVFEGKILRIAGDSIDHISEISEDYVVVDDNEPQLDNLIVRWKRFIKDRELLSGKSFYLKELCMERSVEKWLKFFSLDDIRFVAWRPQYSPEGKVLLDPKLRLKLRPPRPYDSKLLKSLLVADDFDDEQKPLAALYNYMKSYGVERRLCLSKSGILGLVPATAKIGDMLAVLHGSTFPFVLRQTGDMHSLVGEACTKQVICAGLLDADCETGLPTCQTYQHEKFQGNRKWYSIV